MLLKNSCFKSCGSLTNSASKSSPEKYIHYSFVVAFATVNKYKCTLEFMCNLLLNIIKLHVYSIIQAEVIPKVVLTFFTMKNYRFLSIPRKKMWKTRPKPKTVKKKV